MRIQFSDGLTLEVHDTGLTLEVVVEQGFTAPLGNCYLLDGGFVVTTVYISNEFVVPAGRYVHDPASIALNRAVRRAAVIRP